MAFEKVGCFELGKVAGDTKAQRHEMYKEETHEMLGVAQRNFKRRFWREAARFEQRRVERACDEFALVDAQLPTDRAVARVRVGQHRESVLQHPAVGLAAAAAQRLYFLTETKCFNFRCLSRANNTGNKK